MFETIRVFEMASKMASHAGQRQAIIAQNVANADTPEYVAKDIPQFQSVFEFSSTGSQRATRVKHLNGTVDGSPSYAVIRDDSLNSPDGNSVSVEREMLKAVDVKRQHDRALAIYRSAMDVLRQTLRSQ